MHSEPIFQAVRDGDVAQVMSMIDANDKAIHVADSNQSTPLTVAFAFKRIRLAEALIERGANLFAMNHSDKWGMRSIVEKDGLAESDRQRLIELAVAARPDVAPIFHSVWRGDHERVQAILRNDATQASVRIADPNGGSGFYNALPYCGLTPLHYAVMAGDAGMMRILLEAGAEIDAVPHAHEPDSRHTPMYFVPEGAEEIAQLLIDWGADPCHSNLYLTEGAQAMRQVVVAHGAGETPLLRALIMDDYDQAMSIIRTNSRVINDRLRNARIDTPLHLAAKIGSTAVVELLLEQGMAIDTPSSQGYTALALAPEMYCSFEMIKLLVERGADIHVGNASPLYSAIWQHAYGHWDYETVIRYLAGKGSNVRGLVDCVRGGNLALAKLLLELGADVNETDESGFYSNCGPGTGQTALDCCLHKAGEYQHVEMAQLLLKHGGKHAAELAAKVIARDAGSQPPEGERN